jgi:hypothetical protein
VHKIINATCLILGFLTFAAGGLIQFVAAEEVKVQRTPASPANSKASPVRIPHAMAAELEKDRLAIEAEKVTAAEIKLELQNAKQMLDAESAEVAAQEAAVEAMRKDLDAYQRRIATTDTYEVQRFNRKANEYNVLVNDAGEKRSHRNALIQKYNELATRSQAQAALVNQLAEAYNAKLLRNGP